MDMRAPILLFVFALGSCTRAVPRRNVTLHDIDPELAQTEGTDLRYRAVPPPTSCSGPHGCRDLASDTVTLSVVQWSALCDGRFCDSEQLENVDLVREAAHLAFAAEQIIAARALLRSDELPEADRERLAAFVAAAADSFESRLAATERALQSVSQGDDVPAGLREQTSAALETASRQLQHARDVWNSAKPPAVLDSMGRAEAD